MDRMGARALSDAELLALVLRSGDRTRDAWTLARGVLERFGGLAGLAVATGPALEAMPDQAAYLDTLGEIWFCRGNREQALEWSTRALLHEPGETTLLRQHERFKSGAFPVK